MWSLEPSLESKRDIHLQIHFSRTSGWRPSLGCLCTVQSMTSRVNLAICHQWGWRAAPTVTFAHSKSWKSSFCSQKSSTCYLFRAKEQGGLEGGEGKKVRIVEVTMQCNQSSRGVCFFKCVSDMQCLEERDRPWLHSHSCQSWLFWSTSDTPAEEEQTMGTDSLSFTTLLSSVKQGSC